MFRSLFLIFILFMCAQCNTIKSSTKLKLGHLELASLHNPWSKGEEVKTFVTIKSDLDSFYFTFKATDTTLVSKVDESLPMNGIEVSDRVELFFSIDDKMSKYYGMEIDPFGRILDFSATSYRNVEFDWSWPSSILKISSLIYKSGYTISGSISLEYLRELELIQNDRLNIGIFQADYRNIRNPQDVLWYSWKEPSSNTPDFHIPSALGIIQI